MPYHDRAEAAQTPASASLRATAHGGPFASLRGNRPFRLLWSSNVLFFGGVWTQTLVLGWLVYDMTHSDLLVAIFTAVRLAPLLLGPFAGALADHHDRIRLLALACAWALAATSALAALVTAGLAPYWTLLLGGLAIGLAHSPSQPARSALVVELVERRQLSNATAWNSIAMNMTQVIGPALGGLTVGALGVAAALWISTAWYALSLAMLVPLRGRGKAVHAHAESVGGMVIGGLRAIARSRVAVAVLLITVAANICLWSVYESFMPIFAEEALGLDATGLGWLLACAGLGGVVGSLGVAALGDFRFKGALFVFGTLAWGLLWAAFARSHAVGPSFALMVAIGLTSAPFAVLQTTLLLMTTEPRVHGRAIGLLELAIGMIPIASLGLGALAQQFGVGATTFVSALLFVAALVALGAWAPQLVRYRGVEAERRRGDDDGTGGAASAAVDVSGRDPGRGRGRGRRRGRAARRRAAAS